MRTGVVACCRCGMEMVRKLASYALDSVVNRLLRLFQRLGHFFISKAAEIERQNVCLKGGKQTG